MHVTVQEMKVESKRLGYERVPNIDEDEIMDYVGAMEDTDPIYIKRDIENMVDLSATAIWVCPFTHEVQIKPMKKFIRTMAIQHCKFRVRRTYDIKLY